MTKQFTLDEHLTFFGVFTNLQSNGAYHLDLNQLYGMSDSHKRKSIKATIPDVFEFANDLSQERLSAIEQALEAQGLPTIKWMIAKYGKGHERILKRGIIRTVTEAYVIQGAINSGMLSPDDEHRADMMLQVFEAG
jgi:hypothetical protein